MSDRLEKSVVVQHRDETGAIDCPFGHVERIVTGGQGGIANVHVVTVTKGLPHVHAAYDETYYVLSGTGVITIDGTTSAIRPGSVAVIPAGSPHSLQASPGESLEFIIFGTPPLSLEDDRARPQKAE
jgi:mannose-6-phosphate isomerase-like protein (cupin superfamily)